MMLEGGEATAGVGGVREEARKSTPTFGTCERRRRVTERYPRAAPTFTRPRLQRRGSNRASGQHGARESPIAVGAVNKTRRK